MQSHEQHHRRCRSERYERAGLAYELDAAHGYHAAYGSSAFHRKSADIQVLEQSKRSDVLSLANDDMYHNAHCYRQQQRARCAKAYWVPVVQQKYYPGEQEHRRYYPEPVAEQALEQLRQEIDEYRVNVEISESRAQSQQQADYSAYLAADWTFLRRGAFALPRRRLFVFFLCGHVTPLS
ncbi:hypothetical protein SDC9_134872 [bioreactor metagenome]|uniref:Uncharacterized protein n=1 Tax=bioreactor metagenome TaxID=1076179 RepID=A0A645DGR9_9ZZZZ